MKNNLVKNIVISALCIALCYILPFVTGQVPQINSIISPMHLPVLLCGIICGPFYALTVGAFAPIFRSLTLTMPQMFPTAVAMAFELAAYGLFSGIIYKKLKTNSRLKDIWAICISLASAMILGRIVWGTVTAILTGINGEPLTLGAFFTTAFIQGLPGMISQIVIVPLLVFSLKKSKII